MDMARAESLATMMAHSRAASAVEVADLLAGMYMYEWDRLAKYWDDEEKVEPYLQQICRISPQRWHYWIEFHHKQRAAEIEPKKWKLPLGAKKSSSAEPKLAHSAELMAIWAAAEAAAPTSDMVDGRVIPVLTLECVLFAIAEPDESGDWAPVGCGGVEARRAGRSGAKSKTRAEVIYSAAFRFYFMRFQWCPFITRASVYDARVGYATRHTALRVQC